MAPGLIGPPELAAAAAATTPASYISTGNPCLDFFHVAPDTPPEELIQRLQSAYQNDPLKTLKLICNLRCVRGTGKNDKEGFYASAEWLHKNHPKTLAHNVGRVASFGSLKDLLEILFRILEGLDARKKMKDAWQKEKVKFFAKRLGSTKSKSKLSELENTKRKAAKAEKKAAKAKKAIDRYTHDPEYKFLYDSVCDVFANLLKNDLQSLKQGDNGGCDNKVSLAAKWCPSLEGSYDESLLICETIAKKVFPKEEYSEYEGIEEAHYAYRVRTRLRKEVLVPLRKALEVPEVYMCAKRWRDIPYEKVPSLTMHLSKKDFLKHDLSRFEEYLEEVGDEESSIAAGALLPHQLISGIDRGNLKLDTVLELQWKRMVDDLAKQGTLINCTAVCDNEMSDFCTSLLLLVSELTLEPWKGKMVSRVDGVVEIEGEKLDYKVDFVKGIKGLYPISSIVNDLQEVFDRILEFAVEENLGEEEMIRRLFVFTEMEVAGEFGELEYGEIQRKFVDRGFEKAPEIVFWNLRNDGGVSVRCDQAGVAAVTGFSKNLLTLFFKEVGELSPEGVMDAAISSPEYDLLVVHD